MTHLASEPHSTSEESSSDSLLTAEKLGRRLPGDKWLLRDVSLTVRPHERVAVAGPTGAGKTLLLRALALLDPLDEGEVRYRGRSICGADTPTYRSCVMYLPQRPVVVPGTVEENLRLPFFLRVHKGRSFDQDKAIRLLLALGRDSDFLGKGHRVLSGGERQVVALIRAILLSPDVLLLDEPTAALDPTSVRKAEEVLSQWAVDGPDRAFVWVSHDREQVQRVAGRIIRLRAGQLERAP